MEKIKILNLEIDNFAQANLLEELEHGVVFTPNVDHLITLQKDRDFLQIYDLADYKICDSQIIFYIAKFLFKTPIQERIAGSDLFPAFYEYHKNNETIKIFLLGAAPGVAEQAKKNINEKVGREIVIDAHSPSFGFETKEEECSQIIDLVNNSGATVLAVGVGSPKQEKFICKYKDKFTNIKIFLAIGATIDFEAKVVPRCPRWLSDLGLEWFYRLVCDPQRLWKRYFKDLAFFGLVIKQKFNSYIEPFSVLYEFLIPKPTHQEDSAIILQGKTAIMTMPERLTVLEAVAFKENCQELLQDTSELEEIIFNFSQTTFIDSSGVGALVSSYKQAKTKEVKLSLNGVTAPVMGVLSLTGLDSIFEIKSFSVATDDKLLQVGAHPSVRSRIKRLMDILGATLGLLITSILYIPIAIAIKLEDNGSVLFRQTRCGWMGQKFQMWKFRTMSANNPELEEDSKNLTKKQVFTLEDDPRITRVGQFLRKTGLDELPQFWNVLKGEMSLVGTRPPTPDEVENYEVSEWRRLNVKPGMTGEWKIKERTQIRDFQDIIRLDLDYQQNWGLLHDLKLILNTIVVVSKRVFVVNRKQDTVRN